ncbi:MAG: phosphatidate cytidylyltransferase [Clostridia bacterium]|nr:phosphatidate cytidylyltransferase [Clostridia bacterium]
MNVKRLVTALIGFPIVACALIFGNKYVIDVLFATVSAFALYEYNHALKLKAKPVQWIGYFACVLIAFIHIIPTVHLVNIIGILIPLSVLILFLHVIITNMKINIVDIALTLFGICYIAIFLMFIPILTGRENGKLLVWYIIFAAWGTDVFAYVIGKRFGKHKFSPVSPKKSIEGCVGGTIGALVFIIPYTIFLNNYFDMNINYWLISIIGVILSLIGQVGDFSASTIKRYVGIKDFSNLFPGHGGMLDRIDSIIFIAPFAYFLLMLI